jgi:hypothetical protein
MNNNPQPALPEELAVAVQTASAALATAAPADVPAIMFPLREAWLEAVEDGERVDGFAIADAITRLPDDAADAAVDQFLGETWGHAIRSMPILLTFVEAAPPRVLSGIRVLSFEAGKGGDDRDRWRHDCAMALCQFLGLTDGPVPDVLEWLLQTMEKAFDEGRTAGGIEGDPPRPAAHPVYAARVAAAREAVVSRLAETEDLDDLTAEIRVGFDILDGDAWLAVEDMSRAAAVAGDRHAARLRSEQILGVHRWFVEHADELAARKTMTIGTMVMADRSRRVLAEMAA